MFAIGRQIDFLLPTAIDHFILYGTSRHLTLLPSLLFLAYVSSQSLVTYPDGIPTGSPCLFVVFFG